MTHDPGDEVTVIIPTTAERHRRDSLLRAIACVLEQEAARARPLVVINGTRFDPELRRQLEARRDIRVAYLPEGHVAKAQTHGVTLVETPFFSFLDDDDLFTPDAMAHRLALMRTDPAPDVVVTNMAMESDEGTRPLSEDMLAHQADPAHSIHEVAWLHSANNLFRTGSVGPEDFAGRQRFMEWTALAIRLAGRKRIAFSNRVTARYSDTPASASKESRYLLAAAALLASLPREEMAPHTLRLVDRRRTATLNMLAERARAEGRYRDAWRFHMQCLAAPTGLRYLTYTRKLLLPTRPVRRMTPSQPIHPA